MKLQVVLKKPNVRVNRATTAGRQAWAGEIYSVPPARAWWPAVGAPLERDVRPHGLTRGKASSLIAGRDLESEQAVD